jgi:hypothetical protein
MTDGQYPFGQEGAGALQVTLAALQLPPASGTTQAP